MTRTIFRNTFLVGVSVLAVCALIFFGMQYTQIKDETFAALRQEAVYAEQGLMLGGAGFLENLDSLNRIAWIDSDGAVLYDSASSLPNSNQKEFAEEILAIASGESQGIRRAEDSGASTLYYGRLCGDGTVLCLSRPLSAVRYALLSVSPVLWVLVLVLMISGTLSFRVAKQIVRPINELDLDRPGAGPYPELSPLIDRLQEQKLTIQEEVTQREQLRREFSANVSHELKTPLTSISGFAELMAQGAVSEDRMQEFSKDIYHESQRLIDLINDIIRLSRLDEDAIEPAWETVELYGLSSEVVDTLTAAAEKRQVSLYLTGGPAEVQGIYPLLSDMVFNLCDNAIKYNQPRGSVTVDVRGDDTETKLTVTDTGIGISPDQQKRVFERFYRVDKSHSKEIGGTGLGLSIVKHGAQFLGARVILESELGAGTSISLVFPKQ